MVLSFRPSTSSGFSEFLNGSDRWSPSRAQEQGASRVRHDSDDEPTQRRHWHLLDDERGDQDSGDRAEPEAEHYAIVEFDEME